MILQQALTLSKLVARSWMRTGAGAPPGAQPKQGSPYGFLLKLLQLVYLAPILWVICVRRILALDVARDTAVAFGLAGVFVWNLAPALSLLMPQMGKTRSPLRHPLLGELPVSPFALWITTWFQGAGYVAMSAVFILGVAPDLRGSLLGVSYLVVFTLVLSLTSSASGVAAVSLLRAGLPAHLRRKLTWLPAAALMMGIVLMCNARLLAECCTLPSSNPLLWLAMALRGRNQLPGLGVLAIITVSGLIGIGWIEARGYDRIDSAPPGRQTHQRRGPFKMADAERVLFRRERGKWALLLTPILASAALLCASFFAARSGSDNRYIAGLGLAACLALVPAMLALQFAPSMALRDLNARPLLSSLPIEPFQTLDGKTETLRRHVFPFAFLMLPAAWLLLAHLGMWAVAWRLIAYLASTWLLCGAAISVAFLAHGGGGGPATGSAFGSLTTTLLMFPVVATCVARTPVDAAVSVASLAAIAHEAHRAASRCVKWIDDPGELERNTSVWRALLALAAFYAVQTMIRQLLLLLNLANGIAMVLVYGGAGSVLALLTYRQRHHLPSLRFIPKKQLFLGLGILAGAANAGLSLAILHSAAWLGRVRTTSQDMDLRGNVLGPLLFVLVILAPFIEETFFRGWLQTAITEELSPTRRWRAILYGALAFAAVHVGSLYAPQFALGLVTGVLYATSGGLLPGILAHATYNGLVVVFGM